MNIQPAIFFGHGSPINALQNTPYSRSWNAMGHAMEKPKAIIMISAHWTSAKPTVISSPHPKTLYDFFGFPDALNQIEYPAPGDPILASQIQTLLSPLCKVDKDNTRGFDHGTWSVLIHAFPDADIPTIQLSINENLPISHHYLIGQQLAPLREQGVLIAASGNVVHNLALYGRDKEHSQAPSWAANFENQVKAAIENHQLPQLNYLFTESPLARTANPSPEHYLPLLYVLGTQHPRDRVDFPTQGIDGGAISMLSVRLSG